MTRPIQRMLAANAVSPGPRNTASAEFFIELAKLNLKAAENDINRAERDCPGVTGHALICVKRARNKLEAVFPSPVQTDEEE